MYIIVQGYIVLKLMLQYNIVILYHMKYVNGLYDIYHLSRIYTSSVHRIAQRTYTSSYTGVGAIQSP